MNFAIDRWFADISQPWDATRDARQYNERKIYVTEVRN